MSKVSRSFLLATLWALTGVLAQAAPIEQMFLPAPAATIANGVNSLAIPGIYSRQINPLILLLKPGDEIELTLPNGKKHVVVFDRKETHANGDETWIGHVKSDAGVDYRVVITTGDSSVLGQVRTPSGSFQIRTERGQQWFVDPVEAGQKEMPFDEGGVEFPKEMLPQRQDVNTESQMLAAAATGSASSTIDLAVLYAPSLVSRLGSEAAVQTRINYLVALSNLAYIDSGIAVTLRLVHTEQVNFPDSRDLGFAIRALAASENSQYSSYSDSSMASVKAMRDFYGADLVSFIRPFDIATDNSCGLAWLNGQGGTALVGALGYSAVNDGTDVGATGYFCDDYTLVHELGHNMGSSHDIANSGGSSGAYPYSYGYGKASVFGTIMSYIGPLVGRFSSPRISCNGTPCGIENLADNARSINNTRTAVANFRTAAGGSQSPLPQSGWWWNAAEPGRGYFIEVKNGRFYTASYVYDNSGNAVWYVTGPGNTSGSILPGTLSVYSGGQTLTGVYKSPAGPSSIGSMNITFSDSTHGTIAWPGGSVPITRYEVATGSLNQPDPSFKPETGWWWNASEGGRGFSIEVQGDNLFVGGFMYDGSGNPVWYVSGGKMSNPWVYQGTWAHYVNGQSMGGIFKTATVKSPNVGGVTIGFTSTTTATMYLPDGRTIPLTRYSF